MMNKKAGIYASIMVALIIFLVGMTVVNFIKPEVTNTRTDLSCSSASTISDGTKLMCLFTDSVVPYFIVLVLSIAGGAIVEKTLI